LFPPDGSRGYCNAENDDGFVPFDPDHTDGDEEDQSGRRPWGVVVIQ
jgi:hypothetical protein